MSLSYVFEASASFFLALWSDWRPSAGWCSLHGRVESGTTEVQICCKTRCLGLAYGDVYSSSSAQAHQMSTKGLADSCDDGCRCKVCFYMLALL